MKKVKNTELKNDDTFLKHAKEGKIKKNKQKKDKKLKDEVSQTKGFNLVPKNGGPDLLEVKNNGAEKVKKNKKNKKKSAKQGESQDSIEELQDIKNSENKTKEKHKKFKLENVATEDIHFSELPEADRKKIEKKKLKKLAQKLKKKQKKAEMKDPNNSASATKNEVKLDTKGTKSDDAASNKVLTKNDDTTSSNKVLTKKIKKAKTRQIVKDQKLAEKQPKDPAVEAATVFVGNLPVNTKRVQLISLFKKFGPVNSIRLRSAGGKMLFKHKQRKSTSSLNGYVVLKNKETAEKAVSLNGVEFKGHHLRVTLAADNPQSLEIDGGKRTVFVGNLKYSATEESLREIFSNCGEIDYVRCIRDGDKGCKGVAYVCFKAADAVGLALELNKTIVDERPINVERYSVKKLGAKKEREAQEEKEKSKPGAKQRIDGKREKKEKLGHKKQKLVEDGDAKTAKKSEYRGIKVDGLKKKEKSKKKKSNDEMLKLAKKIAPKVK